MKLLIWFGLLTKRLYKKPTFLVILFLIPALVLCYSAAAREESGMLTVALAQKGPDALAKAMTESLTGSSQLIRYVPCESAKEAEDLVRYGKADMAWIFEEALADRLAAFAQRPTAENALATVLVRSDDVTLRLAREKLSGELYGLLSQQLYLNYIRDRVPGLAHLTDGELLSYYHSQDITADLFAFDQQDPAMARVETVHYLTAPLRGLLAVVAVLCAMASAMYLTQDLDRGTFGWVSTRRRWAVELGCQLVSLIHVMAAVVLALYLAGQTGAIPLELAAAGLYCLCCAGFCMMLRRLCRCVGVLGAVLPVLTVGMLLVCPVFFDLGALRALQYFLPPTYYINAVYNTKYLWYMALYTGASFGVYALLGLFPKWTMDNCFVNNRIWQK